MNLSDLIARVEKLEGPDKDVNRAIDRELTHGAMFFADFTGSLDAALALCERMLPGWRKAFTDEAGDSYWMLTAPVAPYYRAAIGRHKASPTLALILTLLKALEASPTASHPQVEENHD